jgi:hypothetical protein
MNIIYEEKQRSSVFVLSLFLLGIVIFSFGIYEFSQQVDKASEDIIGSIIGACLFIWMFVSFYQLRIVLHDDYLQFGYGFMRKKIRRGEILKLEIKKFEFKNYLGYGIRRGVDKSWGYVTGGAQGIMVHLENKKFYFTTDNPEQLQDLIKQYLIK